MRKYLVFNPETGLSNSYDTKEEALDAVSEIVTFIMKKFFHNTVYVTVDTDENGNETWTSAEGSVLDNPNILAPIISKIIRPYQTIQNPTKVETLP